MTWRTAVDKHKGSRFTGRACTILEPGSCSSAGGAWGVDLSPEMIRLAPGKAEKKYPYAEFRQAPAQELPFPDLYFDAIATVFVMHHLPGDEEKLKAFHEMHRVLRK